MKKLVIISHTEHFKDANGDILGWGPTIREVNFMASKFQKVVHIGVLHNGTPPKSALKYEGSNIVYKAIPPSGGKSILSKLLILLIIPKVIRIINREVADATHVQLRLPMGLGVFLLPYFAFFTKRNYTFWVKYAGNWGERKPPLGYRFQRWFLIKNFSKCKVTINGFWKNQPFHCLSFENPCLNETQLSLGKDTCLSKEFNSPFNLVYIGRLEKAKGMEFLVTFLNKINSFEIDTISIIGEGTYMKKIENLAFHNKKIKLLGSKSNEEIHEILKKSNFILLPSLAEGFPKVIAEGACYGVIPVVSNVGSISHYISSKNGFTWDIGGVKNYDDVLTEALNTSPLNLKILSTEIQKLSALFSFKAYYDKLIKMVL